MEVGPDFLAFDTQLVRYPEDDEPHAPGPWADHFRAVVSFAQLYRVMRKTVATEVAGEQLVFTPADVVYYNEQVHRDNYPTPQTMQQP